MESEWLTSLLDPSLDSASSYDDVAGGSRLRSLFGSSNSSVATPVALPPAAVTPQTAAAISHSAGVSGVGDAAVSQPPPRIVSSMPKMPAMSLQSFELAHGHSEVDMGTFFDPKDWPSMRLAPSQPAWLKAAFAAATNPAAQGNFVTPPPGFETHTAPVTTPVVPTAADEAKCIRNAVMSLTSPQNQTSLQEKMAQISQGLCWAAANGSFTTLNVLLACRIDVNSRVNTPFNSTALHWAALAGQAAVVDALLAAGAVVNTPDSLGRTCLDWAAVGGGVGGCLRRLVEGGAALGVGVKDGRSGLDYAAALGNARVVAELITLHCPLDRGDATGMKALHWAAALGRTGVVRLLLLQGGCSPDDMAIDGSTPLHWAVSGGYSHCVQELLSGGADPDLANKMGQRPLEVAATLGRRDLVEALVDGGASSLEAALLAVCSVANALSPHCDVVAALVRLGVDVHCRNEVGKTPQDIVLELGGSTEMMQALAGIGATATSGNASANGSNNGNNNNNNNISNGGNNSHSNSDSSKTSSGDEAGLGTKLKRNKKVLKDKKDKPARTKDDTKGDEESDVSNVVHIGSLPSMPGGTLWEAIKTTMSQFGSVRQVRMTPKSTFAFVEYDSVEEAVSAITQCAGFVEVHGARCTVSWATKRKRKGRNKKAAHATAAAAAGPASSASGVAQPAAVVPSPGASSGGDAVGKPAAAPSPSASSGQSEGGKVRKKKNLCIMFNDTGHCSWGANCKYLHAQKVKG